jgi:hypothetical protein
VGGDPSPLQQTLTRQYARELRRAGVGSHTQIWLDEASSFTVGFSKHHYSRQTQAMGAYQLPHTVGEEGISNARTTSPHRRSPPGRRRDRQHGGRGGHIARGTERRGNTGLVRLVTSRAAGDIKS